MLDLPRRYIMRESVTRPGVEAGDVRGGQGKALREVSASGSHYNIGVSIGKQCRDQAIRAHKRFRAAVGRMPGTTIDKVKAQAKLSLPLSREFYPEFVEEMEGYADGTGIELDIVYAMLCDRPVGGGKGALTSRSTRSGPRMMWSSPPTTRMSNHITAQMCASSG